MEQEKRVNFQVQISAELHRQLKETAKKMGLNTSQLVRQMFADFVKNPNSKIVLKK